MRRLLPEPAVDIDVDVAYAAALGAARDRPWVSLCMVASIDGSIAVEGTSGELSSPTDSAVLARLRQIADVIVVAAGTVREEGYGAPRKPGQRMGVVTRSGRLDFTSDIFTSGAGFVITTETSDVAVPDGIDVIRAGTDEVDFEQVIRQLPRVVDQCTVVQAEGGASLNGALFDADVIDEVNLNISPAVVGADGPRVTSGAPAFTRRFDMAQMAIDDESFVYTRWLRRRG